MKIVVTGGASGLGLAITTALARNANHSIYFTYNASVQRAAALETEFTNTKSFQLDFRSPDSVDAFVKEMNVWSPDVLINNAITGYTQNHFHKMDTAEFMNSFLQNVNPVIKITQQFIKNSRQRKSGKIITILTSALINKPPIGWSEYVANKAYLHSLTKSWAIENAPFGITSNCISPSFMKTDLTRDTDERAIENMIAVNPNKMLLKEEEVAETVVFLINASQQMNGANLIMNAASDLI